VDAFLRSPLYVSGAVTDFSQAEMPKSIAAMTELLSQAVAAGQTADILKLSGEIRTELAQWQYVDSGMADHIHMAYFSQFFVFIAIIILMTLFVWRLFLALEHSRARGRQTAAFSRQMVLAQEQERSRISRELHDTVAQDLSALEMKVQAIRRAEGEGSAAGIQDLCTELSAGHTDLIDRVRTICNDLIPPELRHQGLPDALRRLCYDFEKTANIECRITIHDGFSADPMPVEMQLQCFRLVQEALTNIRKHAEASEATVLLRNADFRRGHPTKLASAKLSTDKTRPGLVICVSDDGKGFAPPQSASDVGNSAGHFGIRGMYERITILGGILNFTSVEREGTMVKIEAPLL
jgi:signal transduction histidine kinase